MEPHQLTVILGLMSTTVFSGNLLSGKPVVTASDYAIGVVLGQRVDKKLNVIQYASKTLGSAQRNGKRIFSSCVRL